MPIEKAARSYLAYLDAEKAAYSEYGSKSIPTLTVRPQGSGPGRRQRPAHLARGHHAGSGAVRGNGTVAERAASLGPMTLIVGGVAVAEGEALAILAALSLVTAEVVLSWLGERRRFADSGAAAAFLRGVLGLAEEALIPAPPTPILPPPPLPPMREDDPGFDPAAPMPALPGFTQAHPTPLAPPETTPGPRVSPVMERQRPGTYSARARAAARRADPQVVKYSGGSDWRAHHLLSIEALGSAPNLVRAAEEAGWKRDDASNMAALPASHAAQQQLRQAGINRPVHDNNHPNWNDGVRREMREAERKFNGGEGIFRNAQTRGETARRFLEQEARKLRDSMIHLDRITSAEVPENVQPT